MMKPYHAITKYEPTPPRPFSGAFHPINLVAKSGQKNFWGGDRLPPQPPPPAHLQPATSNQQPPASCPPIGRPIARPTFGFGHRF